MRLSCRPLMASDRVVVEGEGLAIKVSPSVMQSTTTTLSEAIQKTASWLNTCNKLIDSVELKSNERNRVVAALFHLSLEHHGSIFILV